VAERLRAEFPSIRTFCTLSPIPGLCDGWTSDARQSIEAAAGKAAGGAQQAHREKTRPLAAGERDALLALASIYLPRITAATGDPAKFPQQRRAAASTGRAICQKMGFANRSG
jgi:hypothetical protein